MRVSADRVFELARHLTWRDREIALCLYDHQVLRPSDVEHRPVATAVLLSGRRCQDRLLFLYRHRVLDRFYPPGPFGSGKPQAHWLLDEAGAILVAASMGVEPKRDFASEHEPLIGPDTFQQAQAILAERGADASRRRGNRSDFLLSGVIRCGHCGRAYIGMSAHGKGGTYHYYACTARQKYGPKACRGERIPREKLETAVLHQLASIYRDGPLINDAIAAARVQAQREQPALDERRHAITAEITRTERATERYFEAFEQGKLSPERCAQRITRLHARHDIQPTYRVITPDHAATAGVCATSAKVETPGIEPGSAIACEWLLRA